MERQKGTEAGRSKTDLNKDRALNTGRYDLRQLSLKAMASWVKVSEKEGRGTFGDLEVLKKKRKEKKENLDPAKEKD